MNRDGARLSLGLGVPEHEQEPGLRGRRHITTWDGVDRERAAAARRHAGGGDARSEEARNAQGVRLALDEVRQGAREVVVERVERDVELRAGCQPQLRKWRRT